MSNWLALAAVTETLRALLTAGFVSGDPTGVSVTAKPPDKARTSITGDQLNIFMYQTGHDAAFRNAEMPGQHLRGETGRPPLPLVLYYLLTAYSDSDSDVVCHKILGRAMGVLHDHPVFSRDEIRDAVIQAAPTSDLHDQPERIRITEQPLSLEEMSKLWTTFQTQYRMSAAYQVSVVLIESQLTGRTPLPVLTRGQGDRGIESQSNLIVPYPELETVEFPNAQTGALPGDTITLKGHHLDGAQVQLRLTSPRLDAAVDLPIVDHDATTITATIPTAIRAGFSTISATIIKADGSEQQAADRVLPILPNILTNLAPGGTPLQIPSGGQLAIGFSPSVVRGQRVSLLLGHHAVSPQLPAGWETPPLSTQPLPATGNLDFILNDVPPGEYRVRLRVDGVDSLVIDRSGPVPAFIDSRRVIVT